MGQTWKEFCAGFNKVANKAAVKIEELSDSAAAYVKEKSRDVKLCEEYEKLGRLYYDQLNGTTGKADEIDECVNNIDRLKQEIADLRAEADAKKGKTGPSSNESQPGTENQDTACV